jgi:hypothetical protein
MECMICYEPIQKSYVVRGCNHVMCTSCARQIRKGTDRISDIHFNSTWDIEIMGMKARIKCPMCRQVEPGMALSEFKKKYPKIYINFIELEFYLTEYGDSFYTPFDIDTTFVHYKLQKKHIPYFTYNNKKNKVMQKRNQLR